MINLMDKSCFFKTFSTLRSHSWLGTDPDGKWCGLFLFPRLSGCFLGEQVMDQKLQKES